MTLRPLAALALICLPATAIAQEEPRDDRPRRTRVALGPQISPSFPGADSYRLSPFIDISRVRGDDVFPFEAPDESFGFTLLQNGGFSAGPSLGFEGKRRARDAGGLPRVKTSFEAGGFVQFQLAEAVRVRGEVRKGLTGHKGLVGEVSADYIMRDGDNWLVSVGPRLIIADNRYQDRYFSAAPIDAAAAGLRSFNAKGGLQSAGATLGTLYQFTPAWGVQAYARYDRLVDNAGRSPVVRAFGSRDQFSTGIAATYTFGG